MAVNRKFLTLREGFVYKKDLLGGEKTGAFLCKDFFKAPLAAQRPA